MKKIYERISEINARFRELADTLEKEKRDKTEAEVNEIKSLEREKDLLMIRAHAFTVPEGGDKKKVTMKDYIRAFVNTGLQHGEFQVRAQEATSTTPAVNTMLTADLGESAVMPLTIGELIKPLRENLIYNKIGTQIPTGCRGIYEWPVVEAIQATIAGEGVAVDATKIDLSKVPVVTQRIAVGVEATRESLFNSDGKLEAIIREQLPLAIAETVNEIVISPEKVTENCAITGPFVGLSAKAIDFDFKGFNKAKADLLTKNYKSDGMIFVMTESTKAELEATPKDPGSGIMLIENDRLCGLPVFTSNMIKEGNVGLGNFKYQVCAQFGDFYLTVDPYTGANANIVKFWLNADFGTATLRKDAFVLLKAKG